MKDRLSDFATKAANDPYRLDENGYPFHETNDDALTFLKENKDKPFFLYYATWLVHAPIHTRSEAHLKKYVDRMGVDPSKTNKKYTPGQLNPFYASMVQELDYYVGQVFEYLEETEDPRWPGHKLSENTFIIFTSDNGGMEGGTSERYTDNNPLDRGKISAKEGGTRVPLIITGPGIAAGVQTNVMANGLDFYPTILSLVGIIKPTNKNLDGCDLSTLLLKDPTDPTLVKKADGSVRDTMVWHFPHGGALESTIRIGDYKLIRKYDHVSNPATGPLQLYRLYDNQSGKQLRVDIEEAKDLVAEMPEKAEAMNRRLTEVLSEMKASYPSYNPKTKIGIPHKKTVPVVLSQKKEGDSVTFTYKENGAKVSRADLIYTLNAGERYEEWFRAPAVVTSDTIVTANIPTGTKQYLINLIDENNFLVSFPEWEKKSSKKKKKGH